MGVTSATDRNANICLAFCPPASEGEITANCRFAGDIQAQPADHLYTPRWANLGFMINDGRAGRMVLGKLGPGQSGPG